MIWTGRYTLADTQIPIPQAVGMQTLALLAIALASELVYRASMRHFNGVGA